MYRVFLDNILLRNEPLGIDGFSESLENDPSINGILIKYPSKLTFWGDGYKYLDGKFNLSGYCPTYPIRIEIENNGAYLNFFTGLVFLSDSEKNINKATIECFVADDNYGAKIKNNKNQKAKLDVAKSKNGTTITACPSFNLTIKDTSNSSFPNTRKAFYLDNVFKFLIAFMTDGVVGFTSTWLSTLPTAERLCILKGAELRNHTGVSIPEISFFTLFDEINKKYNIGFAIERTNSGPIMRIELKSYFQNTTSLVTISYIEDLKQSFDPEKLYAVIKLGSKTEAEYNVALHSLPPIPFQSFTNEEYNVAGECNIDKTLDLVSEWIIDTNIIEEITDTNTSNESFDEDIFILQTNGTNTAMWNDLTTPPPYYYNDQLRNSKVSERWSVQGDIVKYLGTGSNLCSETSTIDGTHYSADLTPNPITYNNEISDPNNRFNGTKYTVANVGIFTFNVDLNLFSNDTDFGSVRKAYILIKKYDVANTLLSTYTSPAISAFNLGGGGGTVNHTFTGSFSTNIYLQASEYVRVYYQTSTVGGSLDIYTRDFGNAFQCTYSSADGGVIQSNSGAAYFASIFNFEKGISREDWEIIKANPSNAITINHDGHSNRLAWIKKGDRNSKTSETSWELTSNIDNGH